MNQKAGLLLEMMRAVLFKRARPCRACALFGLGPNFVFLQCAGMLETLKGSHGGLAHKISQGKLLEGRDKTSAHSRGNIKGLLSTVQMACPFFCAACEKLAVPLNNSIVLNFPPFGLF